MTESLLPPNKTALERNLELVTKRASDINAPFSTLWNPWTCPLAALPWLAWSVGVQEWSTNWPEDRKRSVVAAAMNVRRSAGTVAAVRTALASLGIDNIDYSEWHEYGGDPGTYRVNALIENQGISEEQFYQLLRVLRRAGRLSAWLDVIKVETTQSGEKYKAMTAVSGQKVTVLPEITTQLESSGSTFHAMAVASYMTLSVFPQEV